MIKLDKLNRILVERGLSRNSLRVKGGIPGQTLTNLVKMLDGIERSDNLTLKNIDRLCRYLHCQPGEIMEYVEDGEVEAQQHTMEG